MTNADELKSSGLKATLPRIKILEVFQHAERRHMTAEDVFKALLTRSNFESGKSVFELNEGQHHDHLVCMDCGRVEEFYDPEIEVRQRAIAAQRGFELQDHALALYARCVRPDCPRRGK
ncbi:transcriptional repressor [Rubrivivax gelatinosus]|uniref:transcriptional repressor n=1 Tax=Rubrivivax gelatinosus TaxID=28068 RepID=UPI001904FDC9|nr:transcriptional repressor [Rubrivivax gelatinosus]MBK1612856.1 transcriptional repressor [Rubrivivax gelatinosus]